jgi:hypothetical protein
VKGLVQFAHEHLGLDLWPGQQEVLNAWAASGRRRAILRLGRRSGKDVMAAVAAIHNAVVPDYTAFLRPGERRFVLAIGTREQQAAEFVRTVRELVDAAPDPDLRALVDTAASSATEVVFRTACTIRAMPCSSRSTRGLPVSLVVFNEAAHYISDTDGFAAFRSLWRAIVPATMQFGAQGHVLTISTPLWASGHFHQLVQAAITGADPETFHIHRPTWLVNVAISREDLEPEFISDPEGAATEYGAEFLSGADAFLNPVDVYACVESGRSVLPPDPKIVYSASIDPAYERDNFALSIAHKEPPDVLVIDGCWAWKRGGFEATLDSVAAIAKSYRVRSVRTDQYSARPVLEGLEKRGLECHKVDWTADNKYQSYTRLKALINTRAILLPDDEALLSELVHLAAKPLPSGQTRIAAAPGHHDDRASVLAALVDTLSGGRRKVRTDWAPVVGSKTSISQPGGGPTWVPAFGRGGADEGPFPAPEDSWAASAPPKRWPGQ